MAELIDVANAMFRNKKDWKNITDLDKEKFFFIFNRYFSKKYTTKSQLLNNKNVDKSTSLDLWYYFMLDKPYPNWFWSKSPKFEKTDLPDSDFKLLFLKLGLNKEQDLIYLLDNYPDLIQEELKFYKTKIKVLLLELSSSRPNSKEGNKIKDDNMLKSIKDDLEKIAFPRNNDIESKNIQLFHFEKKMMITSYMIYWGIYLIHKREINKFHLIDCIISLQRCINKYSDELPMNLILDSDIIISHLYELYSKLTTIRENFSIKTMMLSEISGKYQSLINNSTFDLSTKKYTIELYEDQVQVMSIIYNGLTDEINKLKTQHECNTPPTPNTEALHRHNMSPLLIWYKVPPSGGKTILSISIAAMIHEHFKAELNKKVLYICYNAIVRVSVANNAKLAGMPFWLISDCGNQIDIPYIGRKKGKKTHISQFEDMPLDEKYIKYTENPNILPVQILITDTESGLELLKCFPTEFIVYLDEPTAGAEKGIYINDAPSATSDSAASDSAPSSASDSATSDSASSDSAAITHTVKGVENKLQRLNASIIKSSINTQLVMLSSTLPELEELSILNTMFPNQHIVTNNRIPVGCSVIAPTGEEIVPLLLAEDIAELRLILSDLDAKFTKYYTFDMVVLLAKAGEEVIEIPENKLFDNYFDNIGLLSSKLIQDYIILLFTHLNTLDDEQLTIYFEHIRLKLSQNMIPTNIHNIIKKGKSLVVFNRGAPCIQSTLAQCNIEYDLLGNMLISKLKAYENNKKQYEMDIVRYKKASKAEKENMEEPIEPEFIWDYKIGNSCVKLTTSEVNLISNELAGLLLTGIGIYDPIEGAPYTNSVVMRGAINGILAVLFSTPEIVYGTNFPLISVCIDSSYGRIATPNSLYQLIGRAGRTGRSHEATIMFNDEYTMKKTILPPSLNPNVDYKLETNVINHYLNKPF